MRVWTIFIIAMLFMAAGCNKDDKNNDTDPAGDADSDVDVDDECALGTDNCDDDHGTCTNTVDGFTCGCELGWHLGTGTTCEEDTACNDGETRDGSTVCGLNSAGYYEQRCQGSLWTNTDTCNDPDVCTNQDVQFGTTSCGYNGNGVLEEICTNGQWVNGDCEDPDDCENGTTQVGTNACGGDGNYMQLCTGGSWDETSICSSDDNDGDLVVAEDDPDDDNFKVCGDADGDGCDDCSLDGNKNTANDGWDDDGDGQCELPLDYDCMNGANAGTDPYRLEACINFTYVNQDRAHFSEESGNAAPVAWNEDIWEVAVAHSIDMCESNFFDHDNLQGDGPDERADAAGLDFSLAENISVNLDPGAAQYGFMEEPTCKGHRGNILSPGNFEVGIGYWICDNPDNQDWGSHHHLTQDFRYDWDVPDSDYCQSGATFCQVPPNPPTTAPCPDQLIGWGFCPVPSASTLNGWNC